MGSAYRRSPFFGVQCLSCHANWTRRLESRQKASPELANDRADLLRRVTPSGFDIHPADFTRTDVSLRSGGANTETELDPEGLPSLTP